MISDGNNFFLDIGLESKQLFSCRKIFFLNQEHFSEFWKKFLYKKKCGWKEEKFLSPHQKKNWH